MPKTAPTGRVRVPHRGACTARLRAALALIAASSLVLAGAPSASAYWSSSGTAAREATTATLAPPTDVTVPTEAVALVPVTWTASTGPLAPLGYTVTRMDAADGTTAGTACATQAPATSCTDAADPGSYYYTVTAVYASWTSASTSSATVTVTAPTPDPDPDPEPNPGSVLLSQGRTASASSTQANTNNSPSLAFDGNPGTRWESAWADSESITVDLGGQFSIERVDLSWENAYATAYELQVSDTGTGDWRTIYSTTTGAGGTESHTVAGEGRFVRMLGITRATGYGFSLWEFQVFGRPAGILSQGRTASATSVEANTDHFASNAVDGDPATRWASAYADPQWLQVDLGGPFTIERVDLSWENAYARAYEIQVSDTGTGDWRSIYSTTTGVGGTESHIVIGEGRFVRMLGTTRVSATYGYSIWEFQVFGRPVGSARAAEPERPAPVASSTPAAAAPDVPAVPEPAASETAGAQPVTAEATTTEPTDPAPTPVASPAVTDRP